MNDEKITNLAEKIVMGLYTELDLHEDGAMLLQERIARLIHESAVQSIGSPSARLLLPWVEHFDGCRPKFGCSCGLTEALAKIESIGSPVSVEGVPRCPHKLGWRKVTEFVSGCAGGSLQTMDVQVCIHCWREPEAIINELMSIASQVVPQMESAAMDGWALFGSDGKLWCETIRPTKASAQSHYAGWDDLERNGVTIRQVTVIDAALSQDRARSVETKKAAKPSTVEEEQ